MKYRKGQIVTISSEKLNCTPYNKHNGKEVKIEEVNTFLGLYEVTIDGTAWALREEGLRAKKQEAKQ